jgi:hypothetical protein
MSEITVNDKAFFQTRAAQITLQSLERIRTKEVIGMVVGRPGHGEIAPHQVLAQAEPPGELRVD